MKRTLVISEEFGIYRVEGSNGASGSGPTLERAADNFLVASGVPPRDIGELGASGFRALDVLDAGIPKQEGRPDVPRSTVS